MSMPCMERMEAGVGLSLVYLVAWLFSTTVSVAVIIIIVCSYPWAYVTLCGS